MNLQLIRKYSAAYPGGLRKLAADAGMSEQTLHRCIRMNKIQAGDLEAIARLLNVEIGIFFTQEVEMPSSRPEGFSGDISTEHEKIKQLEEKIVLLKRSIKDKELIIQLLKTSKIHTFNELEHNNTNTHTIENPIV